MSLFIIGRKETGSCKNDDNIMQTILDLDPLCRSSK